MRADNYRIALRDRSQLLLVAAAVAFAGLLPVARFPTFLWLLLTAIALPAATRHDRQPERGPPRHADMATRPARPEPAGARGTVGGAA